MIQTGSKNIVANAGKPAASVTRRHEGADTPDAHRAAEAWHGQQSTFSAQAGDAKSEDKHAIAADLHRRAAREPGKYRAVAQEASYKANKHDFEGQHGVGSYKRNANAEG